MTTIRLAIVGVGNCASSLVQGLHFYATGRNDGLMHEELGGYRVADIEVVSAFDVSADKVGRDVAEAVVAVPNVTTNYVDIPLTGVLVNRGPLLDGLGPELAEIIDVSPQDEVDVAQVLRESKAQVVVCYMPVGSTKATQAYAHAAAQAGAAFINCNPDEAAHDAVIAQEFESAGVPLLGDDIKSQLGSTALHRSLIEAISARGGVVERTYQFNYGGNTDFLNMQNRARSSAKRLTKVGAVRSASTYDALQASVGPAEHVPFLRDNKVAYMRLEGSSFLGMRFSIDLKLDVEDSPNSAGVVMDAIRLAKCALDKGHAGPLTEGSAYLFKRPPSSTSEEQGKTSIEGYCG